MRPAKPQAYDRTTRLPIFPLVVTVFAFLLPMVCYVRTLARAVTFVDSGELTAVAATLGIAHPPGYPLFTLLGHLLSLIPMGTVILRVGLVSALSAAGTAVVIYRTASGILSGINRGASRNIALIVAPLSGVLLFAFAKTPWSQAVVVEVYALQAFLVMLFLATIARAFSDPQHALVQWPAVAFTFALALTNHLTGVLLLPAFLLFLVLAAIARLRRPAFRPVPLWRGLAAGILPLALYLYLPLRSRTLPPVAWDYLDTWHRFVVHVTARQYHGALDRRGVRFAEFERFVTQQLPGEATWILIALAAVGLLLLILRSWRFAVLSLVAMVALLLYNMAYPIHDIHLYYIPVVAILSLWAAVGSGALVQFAARAHRAAGWVAAALLCLCFLFPLTAHWQENDQSDFKLLDRYVRDTLTHVKEGGIIFSGNWDRFSSPALYLQTVEGYRDDVLVMDMGRLAHPALGTWLDRTAPALASGCREDLRAVAQIANLAERGTSYDVAAARARFARLQKALFMRALGLGPLYVTSDLKGLPLLANLNLIPEGLIFRIAVEDAYQPYPIPEFKGPEITRAEVRDDKEAGVQLEYGAMLRQREGYLRRYGKEREAGEVARRAVELSR